MSTAPIHEAARVARRTIMTPEKVERVMDLLTRVSACPLAERAAVLARDGAGDEEVRAEVESLLRFQEQAHDFLERPVLDRRMELLADTAAEGELHAGDALGEYRVISLLGIGGMGEVYLAEDTALSRRVALKLIQRAGGGSLLRHFRHERRVLAGLNHPNIARLYGSGVTPEGRAYLIMEFVEGERLDAYCNRRRLSVTGRLALFRKVCSAVAYAHQNLVIHRDLKPANIRVTPDGEPKLLDFGIAKLLEPTMSPATAEPPTLTMQAMMTPEYASPEQWRGEPVTTASDVYSLGVVLYELLSGQRPHRSMGQRSDEIARAVCEQEPERPSVAARRLLETGGDILACEESPARLCRRLEGDLDNIVAVAMRKEPARRYPSVSHLSEDLRRHEEGRPVVARRDTLLYRTGKFVRRNKVGVAVGLCVVLGMVAGLSIITWEARRADRRFEDVRRLANYILFQVEPQIANVAGTTQAQATLVKGALEYLDSLSQEGGNNVELRRELAAAYEKVGDVQGNPILANLGDLKGALASYRKAQHLRRTLVASDPHVTRARYELAGNEEQLGTLLWWNNQTDEALASYHAALTLRRKLLAEQPGSADFRRGLASVQMSLADVASWNGQTDDALTNLHEALPLLRSLAHESPGDAEAQVSLARGLARIGTVHKAAGDYLAAVKSFVQARALVEPIVRRDANNYPARRQQSYDLSMECEAYTSLNGPETIEKALALGPRMIRTLTTLVEKDPGETAGQHNLANGYSIYGESFSQAGRWQEALDEYQKGLAIDARLAGQSPENGEYTHSCGVFHLDIGEAYLGLRQPAEAAAAEETAQRLLDTAAAKDPENPVPRRELVRVFIVQANVCEERQQPTDAHRWFQRALSDLEGLTAGKKCNKEDAGDLTFLRGKMGDPAR